MPDWDPLWRDFMDKPLLWPLFRIYNDFMNIKRYEHMPFYFYPTGVNVVKETNKILNYLDWAVDAHEEARNPQDRNKNFYMRSVYFY